MAVRTGRGLTNASRPACGRSRAALLTGEQAAAMARSGCFSCQLPGHARLPAGPRSSSRPPSAEDPRSGSHRRVHPDGGKYGVARVGARLHQARAARTQPRGGAAHAPGRAGCEEALLVATGRRRLCGVEHGPGAPEEGYLFDAVVLDGDPGTSGFTTRGVRRFSPTALLRASRPRPASLVRERVVPARSGVSRSLHGVRAYSDISLGIFWDPSITRRRGGAGGSRPGIIAASTPDDGEPGSTAQGRVSLGHVWRSRTASR